MQLSTREDIAPEPSPAFARVLPLYLVVFIGFVGYSLMITVFTPLLLADGGGLLPGSSSISERTIVLGALLAIYPLAQFVGAPILGSLSDRYGRRPVLLASLAASTCCYLTIALALHLRSLPLLMVGCAFAGLSEANIAIAQSAIADIAPAAQRSRFFGYVYLSSSLAYVVGPLVGGKLADPALASWFGYPTPYLAVALLLLGTFALTAVRFRETHRPTGEGEIGFGRAFASVGAAFARGRLRPLFLANFALYLAIFGFFRVYPMYLVDHFGMGVSRESEFIAWVAVPIVIANLGLVGWLSRRLGPRQMTVYFGLALAACLFVVVIPRPEGALWVTLAACALSLAICLPAMASMISAAVGPEEQGSALGTNQSLQVGAEGVSGLAGGGLAAISTAFPLPAMGALALVGARSVDATGRARGGVIRAQCALTTEAGTSLCSSASASSTAQPTRSTSWPEKWSDSRSLRLTRSRYTTSLLPASPWRSVTTSICGICFLPLVFGGISVAPVAWRQVKVG